MTSLPEEAKIHSSLGDDRLGPIREAIEATSGEIWECGCYTGGTALWMRHFAGPDRTIRAFDTFAGLPSHGPHDYHPIGAMKANVDEVSERLIRNGIHVHPGVMPASFAGLEESIISVAHIDVDQYDSVRQCLEWVYPRVHSGGWVFVDDYGDAYCLGAKKATDDFVAEKGLTLVADGSRHPQAHFVKP